MPPIGTEVLNRLRVAVIVLRFLLKDTFQAIADKLGLKRQTVHNIYKRAVERTDAGLKDSFFAVVQNVEDKKCTGRLSCLTRYLSGCVPC
jgi:predicted transcriptional regulator